nr:hypothetical protein [Tanacetum cinerariifolium]GFA22568.1 hypothetical protein [Tanacetum cinerariifolium]
MQGTKPQYKTTEWWFRMFKGDTIEADDYDAFDSDVDEAPTVETMFMANLSSADPVTDEAKPSYDSDILYELKYQNLKDSIGNNPPTPDKNTLDFDLVFVIGKMQASLQGKDNVIRQLKKPLSQLQVTRSDTDRTLQVQTTDSQITKLTDQVTNLQAQNDLFRAENDKNQAAL